MKPTWQNYAWPILQRAPITEALIDIRVQLAPEVGLENLGRLHDEVRDDYPTQDERRLVHAAFRMDPKKGAQVNAPPPAVDGYVFKSVDGKQVFQARLDGFTVNRLRPYQTWDCLRKEAIRLWDIYTKTAQPIRIKRLALRYINRIELPLPAGELGQWLLTLPAVAPTLPQLLEGYFVRLVIPFDDENVRVIVNQTLEAESEKTLPVILDIEALQDRDTLDAGEIWNRFEVLRNIKNKVFFESITRKTEALLS